MPVLAIDVGTTGLKAAIYEDHGAEIAIASSEYPASGAQASSSEFDARTLWEVFAGVVRKVVALAKVDIHGVSISSHGESFVPVGSGGEPLSPFLLNVDSRSSQEVAEVVARIGEHRLYELTGLPPHPMYPLPKILWLKKHRPEIFSRAQKFLCVEDFLLHRAGVGPYISFSLASRTMFLDLIRGQWSQPLLNCAGINATQLAQPVASGTALGKANPKIAAELTISPAAIWVSAGHDQACCSVGGGGLSPSVAVDGTGTFECISISLDHPSLSAATRKANLPCERHLVPDCFLALAYTPGGVVLKWFRDQMGHRHDHHSTTKNAYEALLENIPDDPTRLLFFPYLLGTGTPWLDGASTGAIFGLTSSTSYAHLVKAGLEGVTYEMKWNLDLLQQAEISPQRIHSVGGGTRSAAWLQLKADIFGREVIAVEGEAGCRGAAACAGVGLGIYRSWQEAVDTLVKPGTAYQPCAVRHEQYRALVEQYKDLAKKIYGYGAKAF